MEGLGRSKLRSGHRLGSLMACGKRRLAAGRLGRAQMKSRVCLGRAPLAA
jgi:hypothetical protein